MKKNRILAVSIMVIALLTSSMYCFASVSFSDIKTSNWAYQYVNKLVEKGGINGYKDGTFKPSNTITNAEFVKILVGTTVGVQEKTGTHWASGYIDKAVELGVLEKGEIAESAYNESMSRELMATAVARTAEKILKESIACEERSVVAGEIYDYGSISEKYKDSVVDVYNAGIITGYTYNAVQSKFEPKQTATRAEATTMIVRLLEKEQRKAYNPTDTMKEVPIGDMIKNLDWQNGALMELTTCVVDNDPTKYEMELVEYVDKASGEKKYLVTARYMYSTILFVKDKVIVGADGIMTDIDGYTNFGLSEINNDITTVDYIGSWDAYTNILTLVKNPFKN